MSVTLIPVGMLKEYVGGQARLELTAGPTVREMLEAVGIPTALVAGVLCNDLLVSKTYCPQDGDTVKVVAVIGGG